MALATYHCASREPFGGYAVCNVCRTVPYVLNLDWKRYEPIESSMSLFNEMDESRIVRCLCGDGMVFYCDVVMAAEPKQGPIFYVFDVPLKLFKDFPVTN